MTYDEILELSRRSMPGACLLNFLDSTKPFLAYEIKVGRACKKPGKHSTRLKLTGYKEDGRWGKKSVRLFQVKDGDQIGVKGLLQIIAQKDIEITRMKLAAQRARIELKAIGQ